MNYHKLMAHVVLFHSVLGLRPVELSAAERLRLAGHDVVTPDLYEGRTASTLDQGFGLMHEIGWPAITQRARRSVEGLPLDAVLGGISMGAGVVGTLLPDRPYAAAVLLLHALADIPTAARAGLPIQVHVADPDDFAPPADIAAWLDAAALTGVDARVFTYRHVGHFYSDPSLPDHDEHASSLTWHRILDFLQSQSH
ncbi:MAG TPA: dienelactone hydrolase family protein [Steroidobacteraceae bacterium]|nr:dienelactone hydrolase family protein [Steroidobacteraceae bacterium]